MCTGGKSSKQASALFPGTERARHMFITRHGIESDGVARSSGSIRLRRGCRPETWSRALPLATDPERRATGRSPGGSTGLHGNRGNGRRDRDRRSGPVVAKTTASDDRDVSAKNRRRWRHWRPPRANYSAPLFLDRDRARFAACRRPRAVRQMSLLQCDRVSFFSFSPAVFADISAGSRAGATGNRCGSPPVRAAHPPHRRTDVLAQNRKRYYPSRE